MRLCQDGTLRRVPLVTLVSGIGAAICLALACPAALAGPPFVTDDPEPVDPGHFEINNAIAGQYYRGGSEVSMPGIDANYGAFPDIQLHVAVSLDDAHGTGYRALTGYGDTELGVKYRFLSEAEDGWWPEIAVYPNLELPTGDAPRGTGAGFTRLFIPVWLEKNFDEWTTYGGVGYWLNHDTRYQGRDYWFAGWALMRHVTDRLSLGGEVYGNTSPYTYERASAAFNLGGTYDISEFSHILLSAGRGLVQAETTDTLSFYVAYQITF